MTAQTNTQAFFDPNTGTVTYVVWDLPTRQAAVIDPVLDYDPKSGCTRTTSADTLRAFIADNDLQLEWILETHAHADHLSSAHYLRDRVGGRVAIGENILQVQSTFAGIFNFEATFKADGSQFDHLFKDGETFRLGTTEALAMWVPGHTPADMAYRIGQTVFVGDTLFMPDVGTARADFPGGDAQALYRSIRRLLALPGDTTLCVCHDYPPPGRSAQWTTTVAAQRDHNIHVRDGIGEAAFVAMRTSRDATLGMPVLILPSVQVNVRAGCMPPPESNGVSYLKIPIDQLRA